MKASDSFCPWWNSISDLFSSCHGVIWDYEHSLTLLHYTVHGYVVIHWPWYIVLSMVISSFIDPATLYCSWLCRQSLTFSRLYCPWLCRHSLTLLHGTHHANVVIHWPCYIVLFIVMSSFIVPSPIALSMVMSSFIDPATFYPPC